MPRQETITQIQSQAISKTSNRPVSLGRVRLAGYAIGMILTIGLIAAGMWVVKTWKNNHQPVEARAEPPVAQAQTPGNWQRTVMSEDQLADKLGVQIVHLAVTGGGGLIDLRYRVVDPAKATSVHDDETPPVLFDDTTGVVVDQLLMEHAHRGDFRAGQTYYLIFENPGNLVQKGSTVSVLLGSAQVDKVEVK